MAEEKFLLGFDIGGTKCAVVLGRTDNVKQPVDRVQFPTEDYPYPVNCLERMAELAEQMLEQHNALPLGGIGIACGGPLDSRKGVIISPPNLPGWINVPVVKILQTRFGVPAHLRNDADAGAVAEWKHGAGQGTENMIFLTFGTGMGAGLILNGRLYSGSSDAAGESGHLRVAPLGPVGFGKAGSFEGFCSGGGITQLAAMRVRERLQRGEKVNWCPSYEYLPRISAQSIAAAANDGDPLAREVFRESGAYLGRGLALLIDLLNPQRIVIGGIFSRAEALLRPAMEESLQAEALPASAAVCSIVPAQLGERIGDVAALALAAGDY